MLTKPRLPVMPTISQPDTLSGADRLDEHPVQAEHSSPSGPYRDGADGRVARAKNLERWLARLSEAEAMRASIEREHALLDESIRQERQELLSRVRIKTACREAWASMVGDDTQRHCARCDRPVFDLSRMTRNEIETLFANEGGRPCVRFHRRPDGRVVTADCPPEERMSSSVRAAAAGALAGAAVAAGFSFAMLPRMADMSMELRHLEQEAKSLRARVDGLESSDAREDFASLEARVNHLAGVMYPPMMGTPE